ncbi:LysE family translocator [Roseibium sp.]|uniref:LysE family translocator n=1 Tax=Roseibium sp. TaxID=1936156 RepID=UPI003A97EBCC
MASLEILIAFLGATLIFAYFPGPALLYTAAQTLAHGRRAGFMAALGIHLGCYLHVIAAVLGLSAIFTHVPEIYAALKIVGGGYMIWLGIQLFRQKAQERHVPTAGKPRTARRAFLDSMLVEILNPKVALFFIAFLPQFVSAEAALPIWAQFLILGTVVNLAFSSADIITVLFASKLKTALGKRQRWQNVGSKACGALLMGLGLKLAMDRG